MKKLAYLLVVVPMLWGCERDGGFGYQGDINLEPSAEGAILKSYSDNSPVPKTQRQLDPTLTSDEIPEPDKKLIKQGTMAIEVTDLKSSKSKIDEIVANLGGYYDNEVYDEQYNSLNYELKIRVPVNQFEKLASSLEGGFDKILDKNVSTVDVTSRYVDLESRLTSKRVSLERYRAILKSAKTIKEILEVEEYIRKIEEEIESTVAQMKQLSGRSSYSTLSVSLTQPIIIKEIEREVPGFWSKAGDSISNGWSGLETFVLVILNLWPLLIFIAVAVFVIKWFRGR